MKHERHQAGSIYEASGKFYVRYRQVQLRDGQPVRVQRSEYLCDRDGIHNSVDCRAVKNKRDEFMLRINAPKSMGVEMPVAEFWKGVYLPFAEKNLRASTLGGYRQIWNQHLSSHFGTTTLREYTTAHCSRYLTSLTARYGRRTLNHIRAVASAIFSHALNLGYCEANPVKGAKALGRIKETANTPHYTLAEAREIIAVQDAQPALLFGLCFYMGLRPSEAVALQWADIADNHLNIKRACVRGVVGDCKTPESRASLPIIKQVAELLANWRVLCPQSTEGWIFPRTGPHGESGVIDLRAFSTEVLRARCREKGLNWKGLYAGRRGAATLLVELTGNLVAAQELLRHKSIVTTGQFYKKLTSTALSAGMSALEGAV
jgi:integrase